MKKTGVELIDIERKRQIEVEGFCDSHDGNWVEGELANAACSYAMTDTMVDLIDREWGNDMHLHFWPFGLELLKRDQHGEKYKRVNDLTKAGALIAAEIDRLLDK